MKLKTTIGTKKIRQEQRELGNKNWPEFMQHDSIVEKHWPRLYDEFLEYQLAGYAEDGILAGVGNSIPVHWNEDFNALPPDGLDWAFEKAADDYKNKVTPNLLVGVQILINPGLRSKGLSYDFLNLMKSNAAAHGIEHVALPVRPTQKHLYPLVPMDKYISWTNDKGEPFDSWIRVHIKAGGKIISICSESMTIQGDINEWQNWTGLSFQGSGFYTVKGALCPIHIDLNKNIGEYIEPNVWIVHSTR